MTTEVCQQTDGRRTASAIQRVQCITYYDQCDLYASETDMPLNGKWGKLQYHLTNNDEITKTCKCHTYITELNPLIYFLNIMNNGSVRRKVLSPVI